MDRLSEEIVSKERKFDGVVINVDHWQVKLPNGKIALREIALHKGASAVVPVDEQGRVAMVRQFRTAVGMQLLEIPAGKLDYVGEDPLACAQRELKEETGLRASQWRKLVALRTTPGFCNETIHMYMAQGLSQGSDDPDEDEFLNVEWLALDEVVSRIVRGEIVDSKTISAILMVNEILKREKA